jgi:hypothetical protein
MGPWPIPFDPWALVPLAMKQGADWMTFEVLASFDVILQS